MLASRSRAGRPRKDFGEHWQGFLDKGMGPALDCLDLIARAVTPPGRPRRFNARFFMARAEDATGAIRHSSELGDIRWVKLDEARELPLPTITGLILGEIGRLVKEPPNRKRQRKIPLVHHGASQAPDDRGVASWQGAPSSSSTPATGSLAQGAASPSLPPRGGVRLRTLVLIRWAAVAGQLFTAAVVHWGLGFSLPCWR